MAVSMTRLEEGSEFRKGKRGKGVMKRWIAWWMQGQVRPVGKGFILGGMTTSAGAQGRIPSGDPLAAILSRHQRALALVSGIFVRAVHRHLLYITPLQTFGRRPPAQQTAFTNLPWCWFSRNDAHRHTLSQTNKTDATDWEIPVDGQAEGHSDFYFATPSLFVKLLWFWCEGRAYVWERYYQTTKKRQKRRRILSWVYGMHKVSVSTYQ